MSSLYGSGYPLCSAHQKRSVGAIVTDGIRGTFITHSVTNETDDYERLGLLKTNEDGFTQIITNLAELSIKLTNSRFLASTLTIY